VAGQRVLERHEFVDLTRPTVRETPLIMVLSVHFALLRSKAW